jgi:hypothetical protein
VRLELGRHVKAVGGRRGGQGARHGGGTYRAG